MLHSLLSHMSDHSLTAHVICQLSHLYERNYCVMFCWVPSHAGLPGNNAATKEAVIDNIM